MANLTEEQKLEIVSMLACFREPAMIIRHFQLEYHMAIDHKQVGRYDPTRAYFAAGDRWREIFNVQRDAHLNNVSEVPIAHQAYRLNILQRGVEEAMLSGNWPLVAKLTEQAAKEVGSAYTSKRTVQIDQPVVRTAKSMSPEERQSALTEVIARALEAMPSRQPN